MGIKTKHHSVYNMASRAQYILQSDVLYSTVYVLNNNGESYPSHTDEHNHFMHDDDEDTEKYKCMAK